MFLLFFFKQKTAYEMRISDWSSDVCSSDLHHHRDEKRPRADAKAVGERHRDGGDEHRDGRVGQKFGEDHRQKIEDDERDQRVEAVNAVDEQFGCFGREPALLHRSEEHTSELQSLMRISYAVFCVKKTK